MPGAASPVALPHAPVLYRRDTAASGLVSPRGGPLARVAGERQTAASPRALPRLPTLSRVASEAGLLPQGVPPDATDYFLKMALAAATLELKRLREDNIERHVRIHELERTVDAQRESIAKLEEQQQQQQQQQQQSHAVASSVPLMRELLHQRDTRIRELEQRNAALADEVRTLAASLSQQAAGPLHASQPVAMASCTPLATPPARKAVTMPIDTDIIARVAAEVGAVAAAGAAGTPRAPVHRRLSLRSVVLASCAAQAGAAGAGTPQPPAPMPPTTSGSASTARCAPAVPSPLVCSQSTVIVHDSVMEGDDDDGDDDDDDDAPADITADGDADELLGDSIVTRERVAS